MSRCITYTTVAVHWTRSKCQSMTWLNSLFPADSTPFTQRPRGRCTGSAASFGCSREPTEWHLSSRRTQVDESLWWAAMCPLIWSLWQLSRQINKKEEVRLSKDFLRNQVICQVNVGDDDVFCLSTGSNFTFFIWFTFFIQDFWTIILWVRIVFEIIKFRVGLIWIHI